MTASKLEFFLSGHTAAGFAQLYDAMLSELKLLYVVKGVPGPVTAELIRWTKDSLDAQGQRTWALRNPSSPDTLEGVIAPDLQTAVLLGDAPRSLTPSPDTKVRTIDLLPSLNTAALATSSPALEQLESRRAQAYADSYAGFAEALRIHDEWEAVYIANMDFAAANRMADDWCKRLYDQRKLSSSGILRRRFLGAATPNGAIDCIPNLTAGLKRYLIKGRAGTGKSTFLKKIAAAGIERGLEVEQYHCGFDPNSLDMVIVRELGFAIFDSTAPHAYDPEFPDDEIVDMYTACIRPGTDELHASTISAIRDRYASRMKQSIAMLAYAKQLTDASYDLHRPAIDSQRAKHIVEEALASLVTHR